MYFKFGCTNCSKSLKVSDEHVGRKAKCPYCHTSQTVPSPPVDEDTLPSLASLEQLEGTPTPVATSRAHSDDLQQPTETKAPGETKSREAVSGTDIGMLISFGLGVVTSLLYYLLLYPIRNTHFGELFYDRGWVPFALTFLMGWTLAILYLKSRKLAKQRESMLYDLLPTDIDEQITGANNSKFVANIHELPTDPRESFLINRVLRGLQHFNVRGNTQEVAGMLASQSEIDAMAVESSYTIMNVFLWAIPILGSIGTVMGISDSVGSFSGAMDAAQEIDKLKGALGEVTGGLGVAFDTTLVALVMSVIIIFPIKTMQKAEEDLLNWVDEYCNENLLKRLKDGGESQAGPTAQMTRELRKAINAAMAGHHAELQTWTLKLEKIGDTLAEKSSHAWSDINQTIQEEHKEKEQSFHGALNVMAEKHQQTLEQINSVTEKIAQLQTDQKDHSMAEVAQSLYSYVTGMNQGMASLNETLASLGEKQINIQVQKRGWFSRG